MPFEHQCARAAVMARRPQRGDQRKMPSTSAVGPEQQDQRRRRDRPARQKAITAKSDREDAARAPAPTNCRSEPAAISALRASAHRLLRSRIAAISRGVARAADRPLASAGCAGPRLEIGYGRAGGANRVSAVLGQIRARCGVAVISEATMALGRGIAARGASGSRRRAATARMVWRGWGSGRRWCCCMAAMARGCIGSAMCCRCRGGFACIAARSARARRVGDAARAVDRRRAWPRSSSTGSTIVRAAREPRASPGFRFGGVIGGSVAAQLGDRLRSFTVVGSNGLGPRALADAAAAGPARGGRRPRNSPPTATI